MGQQSLYVLCCEAVREPDGKSAFGISYAGLRLGQCDMVTMLPFVKV